MAGESARDRALRAREKAERMARYAECWEKGAAGESQTAAALSQLGAGWICWHDLKWPGRRLSNIDHIAIGPGGIFVIDSKNWSGRVEVKNGVLRQNGYQRESAVAGCADSALAVGELVPNFLSAVRPVLCFIGDATPEGWARDVMLCSTANLVEMLATRPQLLSEPQVAQVADLLSQRMTTMPASPGGTRPTSRNLRRPATVADRSSKTAPAARRIRRRLPTFFIGLGIWFCFMVVIGATLSALPDYSDAAITPAAAVAAIASFLLARRIGRQD